MYIPKINLTTDQKEIVSFMQKFSFATLVTAKEGLPIATHLPFVVSVKDERVILTSHFAKANLQWQDILDHKILVIFSEPHAYISPKNYDKILEVPTWNYIAVHAYGKGKIISEEEEVFKLLENTLNYYEPSYKLQFDNLPAEYKLNKIKGIVAFEIEVDDLQAKKKLSQNKNDQEKQRIIDTLSKSKDTNEQLIAEFMKKK